MFHAKLNYLLTAWRGGPGSEGWPSSDVEIAGTLSGLNIHVGTVCYQTEIGDSTSNKQLIAYHDYTLLD